MIFQPDAILLIRERRKTQTRRPVKPGETRCRYHTGRIYSAQPGRGKPGEIKITIMSVRQERLGDITQQDVQREGFRFAGQFRDRWTELHGHFDPDQLVWVITFAHGDRRDQFDVPRLLTPRATREDYTATPALAMRDEPEAIPAALNDHYAQLARARAAELGLAPIHGARDRIASELADMRAHLADSPNRAITDAIRGLERQLKTLDRQLAA